MNLSEFNACGALCTYRMYMYNSVQADQTSDNKKTAGWLSLHAIGAAS